MGATPSAGEGFGAALLRAAASPEPQEAAPRPGWRRWLDWARGAPAPDDPSPTWAAETLLLASLRRITVLTAVAAPVHLVLLLVFLLASTSSPVEARWRAGLLTAHGSLLTVMALLLPYLLRVRYRARITLGMRLVRLTALVAVFAAGVGITAVDQLVTTNVTPFLVACTVVGLTVLLPPVVALGSFALAYVAFAVAMVAAQPDPAVLTSNLANGLAAVGIGAGVMVVLWHAEGRNLRLRERLHRQQDLLEATNRELAQLASFDTLTGLANRRALQIMLDHEVAQMRRTGHPTTLLLLDIDDFKPVNDHHGHPVGDALLQALAAQLSGRVREADTVSRWGGEEFLILLPRTDLDGGRRLAEQLRAALAGHVFVIGDARLRLTASIGVAAVDVAREEPVVDAYRAVDDALYRAKAAGKDRVEVAAEPEPVGSEVAG